MVETQTLFLALIGASGFWALLQYLIQRWLDKKDQEKQKKHQEAEAAKQQQMDEIHLSIKRIEEKLEETNALSVATSRDRLNFLCDKYMQQGFINQKELVPFKLLGEAYVKTNNTEVQAKFEWVMENLKVRRTEDEKQKHKGKTEADCQS